MNSPTESADGMPGREPALEILPRTPLHSIPVTVEVKPVLPGAMPSSMGSGGGGSPSPVELRGALAGPVDPALREQQLQQELLALKQQQQLQKQLLFAEFQKQHDHLTRQHEVQLQKHLKQQQEMLAAKRQQELEQQRQREQQRQEELEKQRLEQQLLILRNKEKSKESAIASTEVKLRLQEFLLSKSKEPTPGGLNHSLPQHPKCWGTHHASLDQSSPPQSGPPGTPPSYKLPLLGPYDSRDDFPLRKTASEPNLKVRSRLKQKVAERRSSPLLRRKDGTVISTFKKRAVEITGAGPGVSAVCNSAPGSGPSSPNSSHSTIAENGFTGSVPNIPTEMLPQHRALPPDTSPNQFSLYTSPSLPNISLGLQATVTVTNSHLTASPKLSTQQEAERQALQSLRQGGALTGKFMSTSSIPGCLLGVALEGDSSPHGHASLLQHVLLLEQARQQSTLIAVPLHGQSPLVTGERVATSMRTVGKLPRHRPLSRTQSSPLPQSPQALQQLVMQQQHQQFLEKQKQQQLQLGKILTKTGELPRQPTTHPEETEEELTEQQDALLGEGALTIPREGSTESESTQEDLEEEEEEEEEEEPQQEEQGEESSTPSRKGQGPNSGETAPVLPSPPPADVSTFLAFPSPEKLLRLGPKSSVLIAQQTDTSDPEKVVSAFLKVSSVFKDEASVRTAVQDAVDALMKKAFSSSAFNSNAFLTRLLIHMGLLKSEDKIKAVANLYGPLMALTHVVQQDYFPKALAPLLLAFMTKPNGALESCSFARHNLLQTLYKV